MYSSETLSQLRAKVVIRISQAREVSSSYRNAVSSLFIAEAPNCSALPCQSLAPKQQEEHPSGDNGTACIVRLKVAKPTAARVGRTTSAKA